MREDMEPFMGRLGIPPVKRRHKRALLREAVGEHMPNVSKSVMSQLHCSGLHIRLCGSKEFVPRSKMSPNWRAIKPKYVLHPLMSVHYGLYPEAVDLHTEKLIYRKILLFVHFGFQF